MVRFYVSRQPGKEETRDEVHASHMRVATSHVALWVVYVLISGENNQNVRNQVAAAAEDEIGLCNEVRFDRRQLMLTY
jgi:hypothetical protein